MLAALLVWRGALPYFFAQDDFGGLARAAGVLPRLAGPWRWVSGQGYFDVMHGLAGLDPLPYRLVTMAAHLACVALLFALLRRRCAAPAALLGATVFAVHPAPFAAHYSISGIGEILALLFGLLALRAALAREAFRWFALPLFALSLLSKESTLLFPLVVLVVLADARRGGAGLSRGWAAAALDPVVVGCATLSLLYLGWFWFADSFALRAGLPADHPYARDWIGAPLPNLLTYAGWTVDVLRATGRAFTDATDPRVFVAGAAWLAALLAGFLSPALRARGWPAGVAIWLLTLAPVLPLPHHTYHYYLYAPLAGVAWCVAAAADVALARLGRRLAWAVAGAVTAALALHAAVFVGEVETAPFTRRDQRADASVDRARIARHVRDDLRHAVLPEGTTLCFYSPIGVAQAAASPGGESYWEENVRGALLEGVAVRLLFPHVRRVEFVREFKAGGPDERWAVYKPSGELRVATAGELDSLLRVYAVAGAVGR